MKLARQRIKKHFTGDQLLNVPVRVEVRAYDPKRWSHFKRPKKHFRSNGQLREDAARWVIKTPALCCSLSINPAAPSQTWIT